MTEFSRTESTYTDDTIAVMRDTITAQRETIAAHRDHIEALQAQKTDLIHQLAALRAKFAGPRCDICGDLCVDLAKDEHGRCPACSDLDGVTP